MSALGPVTDRLTCTCHRRCKWPDLYAEICRAPKDTDMNWAHYPFHISSLMTSSTFRPVGYCSQLANSPTWHHLLSDVY